MLATTAPAWTVRGTTNDVTTCELCGRIELRGTVHLITADGDEIYAGTVCAARKVGTTAATIRGAVKAAADRAEIERDYRTEKARKTLAALAPVEHARPRAKRDAWNAFTTAMPHGGPVAAVDNAIADARATLAEYGLTDPTAPAPAPVAAPQQLTLTGARPDGQQLALFA